MESPIISVMTTTMIATGSATRRPEKMLGSAAGNITRDRMVARLAPPFCALPISRVCPRREPEKPRHHDRVETLDEGERDLRGRSDAEYVGEDGEQRDLGNRVADEEDRLEQGADQHGARHRRPGRGHE